MTASNAVEAVGLLKRYDQKVALAGVDLTVPTGSVTALLGPNGAGKTTAVRILTTLTSPDAGRATVAGFDIVEHGPEVRRRIGLAAQDATVDPLLTGVQNLVMIGELHQMSRADARARATELLHEFDLTDASNATAGSYSGGMRRRLDLAATLVARPEVLFLDEPTTGLDPASRLVIWDEVRRINAQGTTVFLTTQYLEEADQLCGRLAIIDDGRIVSEGTPAALKSQLAARLGPGADPSLDDVFLDATGRTRERVAGEVQEVQA